MLAIASPSVRAVECPSDRVDEKVVVSQVVDGDTLRLKDGRLVRFIGMNSTEIGRDGKPSEPLAEQARETLKNILGPQPTVGLRIGAERFDRYDRTLAHVYLSDGRNVEALLLSAGMAAFIVVPPNVWNQECYQAAEREARKTEKGVWGSYYRPMPVDQIPRNSRGFRVISGTIERVGESKRSLRLNFPHRHGESRYEGVAIRISRNDLGYFKGWDPRDLEGKQVIVRGWMYPYKKQLVIRLRHPAALEIVPAAN